MMTIQQIDYMARRANPSLPYDREADFVQTLSDMATVGIEGLRTDGVWAVNARTNLRYMAALFPDQDLRTLAETISAVVGNPRLPTHTVRLVLAGRSLADPSRDTGEVPVEGIQTVGRVLMRGGTQVEAARASGLARTTVAAIDTYLGLSDAYDARILDDAVVAVREGESVRAFADRHRLSRGTAHRFMVRARSVLVELGEVQS